MFNEIIVSVVLVALLIFFLNPFGLWMPDALLMMMVLALVLVFALFASFFFRESARDERENLHRHMAGRIGFLVGAAGLMIGIIAQAFQHQVDVWLVVGLAVMVLGKTLGIIYSKLKY